MLQRLAAGTKQDEDTYLLKKQKRYVYSLLSSLLCVAGSYPVFTWLPFCRQLTIIDGPHAGNTAPAKKRVRQTAKSAENSCQPAALSGSSKSAHTRPNARHLAHNLEHTKQTYEARFHSLAVREVSSSGEAVLQALSTGAAPPPSTVKGVNLLIREGRLSVAHLQQHPCGQLVLRPDVMSSVPQKGRLWLLLRVGCITGSSWHVFLGFHEESKPYLVPQGRRNHQHVVNAAQRLQSADVEQPDAKTAFMYTWGHMHEPNAYETMLDQYPSLHIYEQPFIQLWTLPPELSDAVSLSELPLLGASPDGLLDADPMADSASGSVLELKSKVPFSHLRKQWRFIGESTPGTEIDAAHFAQVQLEMLVTGKSQAYLVYWSCTVTNVFRVVIDYEWLTEALTLLQEVNIHFLEQGMSPSVEFNSGTQATDLRHLTKSRVRRVSKHMIQSKSVLNHDKQCCKQI